tara:strand:- start:495 stop:1955 length:1461 start_codon:yes stop_codon:yes gene_type:complete
MLAVADDWQPEGYRDACDKLRSYYDGDQQEGLTELLQASFPETWKRLPREMILPVLRRWIDQQATVYLTPPARTLMQEDGSPVEEGDVSRAFERLQKQANLWEVMQRLDRSVHLYKSSLLMFGWNAWRKRVEAHVVPPQRVHVVPDPNDPSDLSRAWAVLVELASSSGVRDGSTGNRRFLAYWRAEDEHGRDTWQAVVVNESGDVELSGLPDAMDFTAPVRGEDGQPMLPMAWVQREQTHGEVYPRPPMDLVQAQDGINETWVDIHVRARSSGFGSYVATSLDIDRARGALNITPGGVTILEEGETLQSITSDSRLSEHVEILQDFLLQQAQRLGLPPSSWAPKNRPNLSGVALKVENLESELARASQINRYEMLEEGDLWDILRAVWNTYAVTEGATLLPWSMRLDWRPGPTSIPTDEEAQRRILDHDVSKNWLTQAQAMSRAIGITEQEAQERLAANINSNREQIRPAGLGLAEAALGMIAGEG